MPHETKITEILEDQIIPDGVSVCYGPTWDTYRFQFKGKKVCIEFPNKDIDPDGNPTEIEVRKLD